MYITKMLTSDSFLKYSNNNIKCAFDETTSSFVCQHSVFQALCYLYICFWYHQVLISVTTVIFSEFVCLLFIPAHAQHLIRFILLSLVFYCIELLFSFYYHHHLPIKIAVINPALGLHRGQ